MSNWVSIIRKIAPNGKSSIINGLAEAMPKCIKVAELTTPLRQEHFLAQLAHESAGFKTTVEYASGKNYEGRKDLGNTQRGDGVRYKGRGLIQVTGRHNYREMGNALNQDFEANPELAAEFPWAALTAAVYWKKRNINRHADRDDIQAVTRSINGGLNGLADRINYLKRAKSVIPNQVESPLSSTPDVDIKKAQKRLMELNYPLGSIDGNIGPLTRSAVRDFQDAMGEPVTGNLDQHTYELLMSSDALKRPVSIKRENLTVDDLKKQGSKIITSADKIKATVTTASASMATAAGIAAQINDAKTQVESITDAVKTGNESLSWAQQNWQMLVILFLVVVVIVCVYQMWHYATEIEHERVRQAKTGENLRY